MNVVLKLKVLVTGQHWTQAGAVLQVLPKQNNYFRIFNF
jgi:hypothetical protein